MTKPSRSLAFMARRMAPSADKAAGGAARRAGVSLEKAIVSVNEWYENRREALIEKVNPPVYGWGDNMGMGQSTVDFTGTYYVTGVLDPTRCPRGIAFDVKSVTGKAKFGLEDVPQSKKNAARERARFIRQVNYLRNARDRHGYAAFFLLYCADLDALWMCDDLETLGAGKSVAVRTKPPRKDAVHHLPVITNPGNSVSLLGLAATVRLDTKRPYLDYLSLIRS